MGRWPIVNEFPCRFTFLPLSSSYGKMKPLTLQLVIESTDPKWLPHIHKNSWESFILKMAAEGIRSTNSVISLVKTYFFILMSIERWIVSELYCLMITLFLLFQVGRPYHIIMKPNFRCLIRKMVAIIFTECFKIKSSLNSDSTHNHAIFWYLWYFYK